VHPNSHLLITYVNDNPFGVNHYFRIVTRYRMHLKLLGLMKFLGQTSPPILKVMCRTLPAQPRNNGNRTATNSPMYIRSGRMGTLTEYKLRRPSRFLPKNQSDIRNSSIPPDGRRSGATSVPNSVALQPSRRPAIKMPGAVMPLSL
jgi:hypothetical protein